MKTVEGICKDLRGLDGVLGAFVLSQSECLATSLPPPYDANRLAQLGPILGRVNQMTTKAGFDKSATAFHWQRASLLAWPCGEERVLGILAAPSAVRETVKLSASLALEELSNLFSPAVAALDDASGLPRSLPNPAGPSEDLALRLERIEQLLVEELGASGKALFERCQRKVPRASVPASNWLLNLRRTVLSEIADPSARVTIAMCSDWALPD